SQQLEGALVVEHEKVGILHQAEGCVIGNARGSEGEGLFDGPIAEEVIWQDRCVLVETDNVRTRRAALLGYRRRYAWWF
ncbi:hypothetical protein, partial [Gulbenkiania mobilis]|uniref:hypothetical protein n=1 Tax=Gulbenkiania mobilis TaxID=397457 RepID=UPI001F409DB6